MLTEDPSSHQVVYGAVCGEPATTTSRPEGFVANVNRYWRTKVAVAVLAVSHAIVWV